MKVVVDTNCLLASIPRRNPEYWLYEAFRAQKFEWYISNEILTEYEEKISEFFSPVAANLVINIFYAAPNVVFAEPDFKWGLIENDPTTTSFQTWHFPKMLIFWSRMIVIFRF